jgi:hypothetical protein
MGDASLDVSHARHLQYLSQRLLNVSGQIAMIREINKKKSSTGVLTLDVANG